MDFNEFVVAADEYSSTHAEQRIGQAYMNSLRLTRPDLADAIMDTRPDADCFYSDNMIPAFWDFVSYWW